MKTRLGVSSLREISGVPLKTRLRSLAIFGMTFLCGFSAHAAVTLTEAQRDWLRRHGKIVFADDTDYPPYTFSGANGVARGLDADVAHAVGRVLGIRIEFRPVQWSNAVIMVQDGRADALAGMVQSTDRREAWTFVEPHSDVRYFLFVREDNVTIHEIKDLEGVRVGVGLGSLVEPALRANPKITVVNYARGKGMEELLNREISAFAGNIVVQSHFIEANGIRGIKVVGAPLLTPLPYGMAVPRDHAELAGILNAAIADLKTTGELATLRSKWFGDVLRPPLISPQALRGLKIVLAALAGLAGLGILTSWELRRMVRRKTARISALRSLAHSFGEERDVAHVLDRALDVLDPLMKPVAVFISLEDGKVRHAHLPQELAAELPSTANAAKFGFRSAECLPIMAEGARLGTFGVLSRRGTFDLDFLHAVTGELGIAIANASLFATLEERVAERTAELNARTQQLEADLSMAREVQMALQPMLNSSAVEIARHDSIALSMWNRTSTARTVGGDFFSIMKSAPGTCSIFICDVMGQGARAALLTAIVRTVLDELTDDPRDAQRFMSGLNDRLLDLLKTQKTPMFATAFYACFDLAAREVTYANAGHPWPFVLRRAGGSELIGDSKPHGPALGLFADAVFPKLTQKLAPGEAWLLYTDGLYEPMNREGESFGLERVQRIVEQRSTRSVSEVLDRLMRDLLTFTGQPEVDDDICLLAVEAEKIK
jgi:sigma-B regulation protein RsbU (phosphoserine phosphatase)